MPRRGKGVILAIVDRHALPLSVSTYARRTDIRATARPRGKGAIDEALRFIDLAFFAQCVRNIGEHLNRSLCDPCCYLFRSSGLGLIT